MQACVNEGTFQPIFWVDGLRNYIVCINSPIFQTPTMRSLERDIEDTVVGGVSLLDLFPFQYRSLPLPGKYQVGRIPTVSSSAYPKFILLIIIAYNPLQRGREGAATTNFIES